MPALDAAVVSKLAKICGLLSSDHDGERSAAAWQATRILRSHGMTWADVIQPALPPPPPPPRSDYAVPRPKHAGKVDFAQRHVAQLNDWERRFVSDMGRRWKLSDKQAAALDRIVFRLHQGGAA